MTPIPCFAPGGMIHWQSGMIHTLSQSIRSKPKSDVALQIGIPSLRGASSSWFGSSVRHTVIESRKQQIAVNHRTISRSSRKPQIYAAAGTPDPDPSSFPYERPQAFNPALSGASSPSSSASFSVTEEYSLNVKKAAGSFWRSGWVGFWVQLALTLASAGILVFALAFPAVDATAGTSVASLALICTSAMISFLSTLWTFGYTRVGYRCRLTAKNAARDNEKVSVPYIQRVLKTGIVLNVSGLLLCVLGLLGTTGTLLAKLLTQSMGVMRQQGTLVAAPVQPIDLFVVQAASNILLSLVISLIVSLWLTTQYRSKLGKNNSGKK